MIRVCEDEELGMSSIIRPQHSSSLKSVLDWLCSSCVLDASFARSFAAGLPENARETHVMKFMASLVSSGKRDRFFRTTLIDMIKADIELMTYTAGKVIESTRKTFRKIRHFLLPARLPSRVAMIAFERQSKADNFKFANQVYGHPTEQMSDVSSIRLRSQLDVHIDEAGIVDPLNEGFPGICTSKFPSKQSESSHSGANPAFASSYFVEPVGRDLMAALMSLAEERALGFPVDAFAVLLSAAWKCSFSSEILDLIPKLRCVSSKRKIGSASSLLHQTGPLRNIWEAYKSREAEFVQIMKDSRSMADPAAMRIFCKSAVGLTDLIGLWEGKTNLSVPRYFHLNVQDLVPERPPLFGCSTAEIFEKFKTCKNFDVSKDLCDLACTSLNRLTGLSERKMFFSDIDREIADRHSSAHDHQREQYVAISVPFVENIIGSTEHVLPDQVPQERKQHFEAQKELMVWFEKLESKLEEEFIPDAFVDSGFFNHQNLKLYVNHFLLQCVLLSPAQISSFSYDQLQSWDLVQAKICLLLTFRSDFGLTSDIGLLAWDLTRWLCRE